MYVYGSFMYICVVQLLLYILKYCVKTEDTRFSLRPDLTISKLLQCIFSLKGNILHLIFLNAYSFNQYW